MLHMFSSDLTVLKAIQTLFQLVGTITAILWVGVQFGDRLWRKSERIRGGDQAGNVVCQDSITQILKSQQSLRRQVDELQRQLDDLESDQSGTDRRVEELRRAFNKCNAVVAEIQKVTDSLKSLNQRRHGS